MANNLFVRIKFTQFVNCNVRIQGRKLYSASLEDVAWLEDAQLMLMFNFSTIWLVRRTSQTRFARKKYN